MTTPVKRACDACHRRKVKCDGINPCKNCGSAQLACTYNAVPQKKGPKGSRAKVISELRENQRQTSLSAKIHGMMIGMPTTASPPSNTLNIKGTPGLLSMDTMMASIDYYFEYLYHIAPIINRQRLVQQALYMDQNQSMDTYCLLSSLVAFTMIQPGAPLPGGDNGYNLSAFPGAHITATQILLDETTRVRKGLDYITNTSFNTLCTNYFLFATYHSLEYHDKAWYYLREATSLMTMRGMNLEETYLKYDNVEAGARRRLYWLFFIAERVYALQFGRPLTLQPSISLPTVSDPGDSHSRQLCSFVLLAKLFRPFDLSFMEKWNKLRGEFDSTTLANLQSELTKVLPTMGNVSDPMQDLVASQQWLKSIEWRMRCQNGTVEADNQEATLSLSCNGNNQSSEIVSMRSQFTTSSNSMVDQVMIGKLLSISLSMTEYLETRPASRNPFVKGPREHLHELLNILSVLRNGDHRFLPSLMSKVQDALQKLPKPLLAETPELLAQNLASIDIFDGFGNLGMAPMDFEEKKYTSNVASSPMNAGGPTPSMPEISSQFSPPIVSPGMEFPQNLQDFNTPLEMNMNRVSQAPNQAVQNLSSAMMNSQQPQQQQQQQQQQQLPQQGMSQHHVINVQSLQNLGANMSQQLNFGMSPENLNTTTVAGMAPGLMANQMMSRTPAPQRSNSFSISAIPRTVGDFQALQRVKTEMATPQLAPAPQPGGLPGANRQQPPVNMALGEITFNGLQ